MSKQRVINSHRMQQKGRQKPKLPSRGKLILHPLKPLSDLLSLVGVRASVARLRRLSAAQREDLRDWAAKTHLAASDNPVRVPPRPAVLDEFSTREEATEWAIR